MKNKFTITMVCMLLLAAVLGCSSINPLFDKAASNQANANKSLTDRAVDTAVGEEKIGVPECDEVMNLLAAEANNPDDNFVTKAIKATVLNKIKTSIKESVEKNKNDTTKLAKDCRVFRTQLEKYKAEEEKKKTQ